MIENSRLLLPYAVPYLAYTGIASLPGDIISTEISYVLRIAVTVGLLFWGWQWYLPVIKVKNKCAAVVWGIAYGIIGCILWILFLAPLTESDTAEAWSTPAFMLRFCAAGLVVPVFEELMTRVFTFRLAYQWHECRMDNQPSPLSTALNDRSINDVAASSWSWPAVLVSVIVFTAGHSVHEWPAAIVYALLMTFVLIKHGGIFPCIIAHATTNMVLVVYVFFTESWHLW